MAVSAKSNSVASQRTKPNTRWLAQFSCYNTCTASSLLHLILTLLQLLPAI